MKEEDLLAPSSKIWNADLKRSHSLNLNEYPPLDHQIFLSPCFFSIFFLPRSPFPHSSTSSSFSLLSPSFSQTPLLHFPKSSTETDNFTMPFLSEAASALKSRFGFHDQPSASLSLVQNTPDLLKSAAKDSLAQSSIVRNLSDWDDESVAGQSSAAVSSSQSFEFCEDPSFWKDHNVQVQQQYTALCRFSRSKSKLPSVSRVMMIKTKFCAC